MRGFQLLIFASLNLLNSATNKHNTFMFALLNHIHVGHEPEAFSPQMIESQTTASKNEIDDSVEFASAVETQQCTSERKNSGRCVPLHCSGISVDTNYFL